MLQRWRAWWSGEQGTVGMMAFWLAAASVCSRLLGVLRDRLLATHYGAGWQLDAYYAAFRLPDTLYSLLIVGALSAGFIPLFSELRAHKGEKEAFTFSSAVLLWVALALGFLSLGGIVFAPLLVPLIAHGFDTQRLELAIPLTRILFLSPLFLGISAVFGGVLQASKRVLAFAFAPVWYNLGILFGILCLSRWFGISGVAIGVVLGAAMHALTQGIVAFGLGLRWPTALCWSGELTRLLKLTAPRLAALGASQISLVVLLSFASTLRSGSVAVFQLGNNLQSFPLGVIGISFAIAAFPLLSEAASAKKLDAYHEALGKAGRTIVFFLLPVSLLFILLRAQLVRLILGDGQFDWLATIDTAAVVGWLSVSLVAQALIPLLARAFYAIQSTWTPFWITLFGEVVNLGLAWSLKDSLGVTGLAVSFSVATFLQLCLLWMALRRRVGNESQAPFLRLTVAAALAAFPALCLAYAARHLVGTLVPLRTFWQVLVQFVAAGGVGGVTYLLVMWLCGVKEAEEWVLRGKRLLRR